MTEIGTGVGYVLVKPQLVEVIPEIVMMGNVFRRTRKCVERGLTQMLKCQFCFQSERQIEKRGIGPEAEKLPKIPFYLNIPSHILFTKSHRHALEHMLRRLLRHKGEKEMPFACAVGDFLPIPELHLKGDIRRMIAQFIE